MAESERVTKRRRAAIASGSLLGVALLAGGVFGITQLAGDGPGETEAASGSQNGVIYETEAPPTLRANPDAALQAEGPAVPAPRSGPGSEVVPCGPVDETLGTQLAEATPSTGGPVAVPEQCPPGSRAAAVPVEGGMLYVIHSPVGSSPEAWDPQTERDDGARGVTVEAGMGMLTVMSVPEAGGEAPMVDELPGLADELSAQFNHGR